MAEIDASIPLQAKQFQAPDIVGDMGRAYELKNLQTQGQLQQYQLQDIQQGRQDREKIKALYAKGGYGSDQFGKELGAIDPAQASAYQKTQLENKKTNMEIEHLTAETQKLKEEKAYKLINFIDESTSSAIDAYENALKNGPHDQAIAAASAVQRRAKQQVVELNHMTAEEAQKIPDTFDPNTAYAARAKILGAKAQMDLKFKEKALSEKTSHDKAMENKSGGRWLASSDAKGNPTWVWASNPGSGAPARSGEEKQPGSGGGSGGEAKTGPTVPGRSVAGKVSAITQRYNQRSVTAANEVLRGLKQIEQMPKGESAGLFNNMTSDTIFSANRKFFATKMTSDDSLYYNTAIAGMGLELTTLLRGGMQINETEINSVTQGVKVEPGEPVGVALYKFANTVAKARTAMLTFEPSNPQEAKEQQEFLSKTAKYATPEEVYAAQHGQPKPPKQEIERQPGQPPPPNSPDQEPEAESDDFSHLWER